MKAGDYAKTPRFLNVKIQEVFDSVRDMLANGYTEPTHYDGEYAIQGKSTGINLMQFAAAKRQ